VFNGLCIEEVTISYLKASYVVVEAEGEEKIGIATIS